jgi:hypothetical protein
MKKHLIIASLLVSAFAFNVNSFACDAPNAHHKNAKVRHEAIHKEVLNEMTPAEKLAYNKVSKMVDEMSMDEKKALHVKLMHEHMMMSKEERKEKRAEHKEHMKHVIQEVKKKEQAASANETK